MIFPNPEQLVTLYKTLVHRHYTRIASYNERVRGKNKHNDITTK